MEQISKITNYEFSETDDFVDITSRLSYFNDYNANGFRLLENENEEITKKSVNSLINTPVVAYYNARKDDFEGHKVIKTKDGIQFGTQAVGTHVESWVQIDKVKPIYSNEEVELPCIYGKARIWASRFPKFYNVLKKRLEKDEMYTSWELNPITLYEDEIENSNIPNPRTSDNFIFLGNCLLGSSPPAYGETSKVLEMSSVEDFDIELSEALEQDIITLSEQDEDINIHSNNKEGGYKMPKKNEQSALSLVALEQKLWDVINPKGWSSNPYYSVMNIYPEEHKVLCRDWDKTDEELMVFDYSINENDEVTVSGGVITKLSKVLSEKTNVNIDLKLDDTAKLISEKEIKIKELDTQISELQTKLSEAENEIAEAGKAISELQNGKEQLETQISELTPFKEKVEEMEQAEKERELAEKKDELKTYALEDNLISETELSEDETLSTIFSELTLETFELSQEKIDVIKGKRAIAKFKENKLAQKENQNETEVSEVETSAKAKTDLNNGDSDGVLTAMDIMKSFLGKK